MFQVWIWVNSCLCIGVMHNGAASRICSTFSLNTTSLGFRTKHTISTLCRAKGESSCVSHHGLHCFDLQSFGTKVLNWILTLNTLIFTMHVQSDSGGSSYDGNNGETVSSLTLLSSPILTWAKNIRGQWYQWKLILW